MSTEDAVIRDSMPGRYNLGFYLRYLVGTETDAVRVVSTLSTEYAVIIDSIIGRYNWVLNCATWSAPKRMP